MQAEDTEVGQHWVGTPVQPFVGLLLRLSEPQFPRLKNGTNEVLSCKVV